MLIGKINELTVDALENGGCYLSDGKTSVYLPKKETAREVQIGDTLEAFVYNSDRETIRATLQTPLAQLDEFAALDVKALTDFGAFLDWGIEKDLFLPKRNFKLDIHTGQKIIVFIKEDPANKGVIASAQLEHFIHKADDQIHEGKEVQILVYEFSELGYKVIIDNRYEGLLYQNEVFEKIPFGTAKKAYIKKIREDGKIDVALRRRGYVANIDQSTETILRVLEEQGGFLPLHDKSNPVIINSMLGLSKKLFKKAIGKLYKDGKISIDDDGIRLRQ